MKKHSFDDITPPQNKRSIRNISLSDTGVKKAELSGRRALGRRRDATEFLSKKEEDANRGNVIDVSSVASNRGISTHKGSHTAIWGVVSVVAFVGIIFAFFTLTAGARIVIEPRVDEVIFNDGIVYTAYKDPENGDLGYKIVTKTLSENKTVKATSTENVSEKASGEIVIYNDTASTARWVKRTRFESKDGNIYRVRNSVVVPGKKNGKSGTLTVTVYADEAGDKYNIQSGATMTIPGLKGTSKYTSFSAKVKDEISGGFIGEKPVVNSAELESVKSKLRANLFSKIDSTKEGIADDVYIFDDLVFVKYSDAEIKKTDDGATISEDMTVDIITFDKGSFTQNLVSSNVEGVEDRKRIAEVSTFTLSVSDKESVDIANDSLIQFTLDGSAKFISILDEEKIKSDLAGTQGVDFKPNMKKYIGVEKADLFLRPFWVDTISSNPEKLKIEIKN